MSQRDRLPASWGAVLIILFAVVGFGSSPSQSSAPAIDVVHIDSNRLIDAAVRDCNRFAVDIPHAVDASQSEGPRERVRQGCGRVSIGHSDLNGAQHWASALEYGRKAGERAGANHA
jgi:hypothetical protein